MSRYTTSDGIPCNPGRRECKGGETRRRYYQAHRWVRVTWVHWCLYPKNDPEPLQLHRDAEATMSHIIAMQRYALHDAQGFH